MHAATGTKTNAATGTIYSTGRCMHKRVNSFKTPAPRAVKVLCSIAASNTLPHLLLLTPSLPVITNFASEVTTY